MSRNRVLGVFFLNVLTVPTVSYGVDIPDDWDWVEVDIPEVSSVKAELSFDDYEIVEMPAPIGKVTPISPPPAPTLGAQDLSEESPKTSSRESDIMPPMPLITPPFEAAEDPLKEAPLQSGPPYELLAELQEGDSDLCRKELQKLDDEMLMQLAKIASGEDIEGFADLSDRFRAAFKKVHKGSMQGVSIVLPPEGLKKKDEQALNVGIPGKYVSQLKIESGSLLPGGDFTFMKRLTSLRELWLEGTDIDDENMEDEIAPLISRMTRLKQLTLRKTSLTTVGFRTLIKTIRNLKQLKKIDFKDKTMVPEAREAILGIMHEVFGKTDQL